MLGSLRNAAPLLLVAVIGVGAASAAPASPASVQPDVVAKRCKPGFRHAIVAGTHRCLKAGQKCARRFDRQYHRVGLHCHGKRLTRIRRTSPPPPPSAPVVRELPAGPIPAGTYRTSVFSPRTQLTLGSGWLGVGQGLDGFELLRREGENGLGLAFTNHFRTSSVAQAVATLSSVPGLSATAPAAGSLAGFSGQQFVVTVTAATRVVLFEEPGRYGFELHPGDAARIDVIDVRGATIVIIVEAPAAELTAFTAEADAVLATVLFP